MKNQNQVRYFKWFGNVMEGVVEGETFISDKIKYSLSVGEKFESCGLLTEQEIKEHLNNIK